MIIKSLKVAIQGPIWSLNNFEIEGIDVIDRLKEDTANSEVSVTVTNFELSPDDILNIFVKIGAPNRSTYKVVLSGQIDGGGISKTTPDFVVRNNGRLNILINENINDIIS